MLLRKIEEIRKQPKSVRDRYALSVALAVTSFLAVVWLISLPARFNDAPELTANIDDEAGGFSRALEDVQGQFANIFSGLDESINELQHANAPGEADSPVEDESLSPYQLDIDAMFDGETEPTDPATQSDEFSTTAPATASNSTTSRTDQMPQTILIGTSSSSNN